MSVVTSKVKKEVSTPERLNRHGYRYFDREMAHLFTEPSFPAFRDAGRGLLYNVMAEAEMFIGTAGWSYPDWENVVYPAGKKTDRLASVARYLDCIEVDSSFYRPPTPRTTERWVNAVTDRPEFRFLAKAWQRFTHERATPWNRQEFDVFTQGLAPLRQANQLDVLLFQFPWSFRNNTANRDWLARLGDAFNGWPVAVEVRHDSWQEDEIFEFFRQRHFTFCNIDQPALPHCLCPTTLATTEIGYYRLHGRNEHNWFQDREEVYGSRYDHLYSDGELAEVWDRLRKVAAQTKKLYAVFNNHKDAKAFANALQIKARARPGKPIRAPAALLQRFPTLRSQVLPDGEEQLRLV